MVSVLFWPSSAMSKPVLVSEQGPYLLPRVCRAEQQRMEQLERERQEKERIERERLERERMERERQERERQAAAGQSSSGPPGSIRIARYLLASVHAATEDINVKSNNLFIFKSNYQI